MNPSIQAIKDWAGAKGLETETYESDDLNDQFSLYGRLGSGDLSFTFYLCHNKDNDEDVGFPFVALEGTFRVNTNDGNRHRRPNKNYFGRCVKLQKNNSFKTTGILQTLEKNWKIWERYYRQEKI